MITESTDVVIYARYSSHNQNETSIEGQLKVCYDFCKRNNYTVIHEYIDRALTGTSDNRPEFQQMIEDAARKKFQYIIVYQLDRFSRNRYDSAIYKNKLKKHGVRVLSARENISEDASGILMESVLEGMAEYFSAELSQKVKRGRRIYAEKCLFVGGNLTYGYAVNEDRSYRIDPVAASVVQRIFEDYANGKSIKDICNELNEQGYRNYRGAKFIPSRVGAILRNKKYIGTFEYQDISIPDGIPRIVSDELFNKVAEKLISKKNAPAASRDIQYLLSGKLYCGHCHEQMIGYCGTGRKNRYYYYICKGRKAHTCDKEYVHKEYIEELVLSKCRELLDDKVIDQLITVLMNINKAEYAKSELASLEKQLLEIERKMQNLTNAIIECDLPTMRKQLYAKMPELEDAKSAVETQISEYTKLQTRLNEKDVRRFLLNLRDGSYDNENTRRQLINTFINRIYLYDDRITLIYNTGHKSENIAEETLEYIEKKNSEYGSSLKAVGTLLNQKTNTFCLSASIVLTYWF